MSNLLVQNIKHTNNTTAATVSSSGGVAVAGTLAVTGVHTVGNNAIYTSDSGAVTQNMVQSLVKGWLNFKGDGTVAVRDSLNFTSVTDDGTGTYELNINNNMANINYHFNPFHRSNSQTSGIAEIADQETGKIDDHKTFAGASTLIDRELGGGLIAGDLA